jgi:hypothetical protein
MTNEEAEAMFRADAIAAGLPPDYDPNKIAFTLWDWLEESPADPDDPLWREVWFLMIGHEIGPDAYTDEFPFNDHDFWQQIEPLVEDHPVYVHHNFHERRREACRCVLCRQQLNRRTI